jgi:Ca-activated chloride channel family protein
MRALALACTLVAAWTATPATQPTFSSRVEGVRVDVLVTDSSRRPLRDLTPADFIVRDNGVPQQVDLVSFGEIPLNVGLAFDLSESVAGRRLEQLKAASEALTAELRQVDQSALVAFNHAVSLKCPLSLDRVCVKNALNAANPVGQTALVDGVFAGMMVGESDVGRSLLMVFSDGLDTVSFLPTERVLEIARRSDVVVYPIAPKDERPDFLEDVANLTGGRLQEVDRKEDLSTVFRTILDEFRHRYLLTYTPRNVPRSGWHTLDVRVNRSGARVRARPGYQGE